jgi:DNA helicase-2/ATP-dependent DNA helicase PcrA
MTIAAPAGPERLLDGLNGAQREAVEITSGPLAVIAGAGSGKTRVISHRAAYAIETGVVPSDRVLLVTFTDKAATEMVDRMASLGHRGVMAKTFHAMALSQLRWFWPSRHDGAPAPRVTEGKVKLLYPLAAKLPGGYRFTQVKDLAETIEWAKVRRIRPERWIADGGDRAPIPPELFARLYADYERGKARAGVIDFEDMLVETVSLLETDEAARALVQSRRTWFSVDEYQDTNPLAERLLHLWLGESRDLAVVGDPDQTIYTFTGATPEYLLGFEAAHPGARVVALVDNYRSTPEILTLANRLVSATATALGARPASRATAAYGRALAQQPATPLADPVRTARPPLRATRPSGPAPTIRRFADDEAERGAIVASIRDLLSAGTEPGEIAVLVRINAQLPELEQALTRAGVPFTIRGQRFFDRREIREARRLLGAARIEASSASQVVAAVRHLLEERLGFGADLADGARAGDEGAERDAALGTLMEIVEDLAASRPDLQAADVVAELDRRDAAEAAGSSGGVNLLTYHRAKGLEWDAVFLPALEEGLLPIRQAKADAELEEERRLLYVGITRARTHLALSWAQNRSGSGGPQAGHRRPSRFLAVLEDPTVRVSGRVTVLRPAPMPDQRGRDEDSPLMTALREWRTIEARSDGVPAYVVAPDSLLIDIAEQRPTTIPGLRRVKGMGPSRLARYGEEILVIVRQFV